MLLIKNVEIFAPEYLGCNDILICGDKIHKIEPDIQISEEYVEIIQGEGRRAVPGYIDGHVHITGGGGEGGFTTRVPEIKISELVDSGITTVVGLLGTDGTTRSVENLIAKAKSINELGITCYALTGSYEYPTVTLTGSIKKDIVFIDEIIGTKMAVSDHRSSSPSVHEISRVASDTKLAGMLSGKAGIVTLHMGDGKKGLGPIMSALEETDIPIFVFRPTHVNRKLELLHESFQFANMGGYIDITCGMSERFSPWKVILKAKEEGVPMERITISSDGYGSWSNYDSEGKLLEIGVSSVNALHNNLVKMIGEGFELSEALRFITTNPAKSLRIDNMKGALREGCHGDILLLDQENNIDTVISKGLVMKQDGVMKKRFPYEDR